jgi:predicted kinase
MGSILYIFSGLPCSGKTTLAKALAKHTKAAYFRIDTIEQGIKDLCSFNVQGEGYRLAYRLVEDNLKIGNDVIADSCNPLEITRKEWKETAVKNGSVYVNIVVKCSDKNEHKHRVETRKSEIKGLILPDMEVIKQLIIKNTEY